MIKTMDQIAPTQPRTQRFYCEGCQQWHEVESLLEAVRRESERIRLEKGMMMITIYDLFNAGWTAHPASLYDEEGVEGWRWEDAEGNERGTVLGGWDEAPLLPELGEDELRAAIAPRKDGEG